MKIDSIRGENLPPLREISVPSLGNLVIIAGANGSGKTTLREEIVNTLKSADTKGKLHIEVSATHKNESANWRADKLNFQPTQPNPVMRAYLKTKIKGQEYFGNVVQVQSDRSIKGITYEKVASSSDPDDSAFSNDIFLQPFSTRWKQTVQAIHQKVAARDRKVWNYAKANPDLSYNEALAQFPDSFIRFQEAFSKLLPGKQLIPIAATTARTPTEFKYEVGGTELSFSTLSSGEQEIVRIVFDLMRKNLHHCVIIVDEPELHLHPSLVFRLVETIKSMGDGTNQLIFFTHSAELISTYYSSGNVYYVDPTIQEGNQAISLIDLETQHSQTARLASANLGVFAVAHKLMFVEGASASVDRLVYQKIAQAIYPELHIVPLGSVRNVAALRDAVHELSVRVFGIDLFLVRDRDGLSDEEVTDLETNRHFRCLPRRHIENYFLDADVLSLAADALYIEGKTNPEQIDLELKRIAASVVKEATVATFKDLIQYGTALQVPTIKAVQETGIADISRMLIAQVAASVSCRAKALDASTLEMYIQKTHRCFEASLTSEKWKSVLPGKPIFSQLCGQYFNTEASRFRHAYVDQALAHKPAVFDDIIGIFQQFRSL